MSQSCWQRGRGGDGAITHATGLAPHTSSGRIRQDGGVHTDTDKSADGVPEHTGRGAGGCQLPPVEECGKGDGDRGAPDAGTRCDDGFGVTEAKQLRAKRQKRNVEGEDQQNEQGQGRGRGENGIEIRASPNMTKNRYMNVMAMVSGLLNRRSHVRPVAAMTKMTMVMHRIE